MRVAAQHGNSLFVALRLDPVRAHVEVFLEERRIGRLDNLPADAAGLVAVVGVAACDHEHYEDADEYGGRDGG